MDLRKDFKIELKFVFTWQKKGLKIPMFAEILWFKHKDRAYHPKLTIYNEDKRACNPERQTYTKYKKESVQRVKLTRLKNLL